jgi:phospholipid N-methyltransferase
MSASVLSYLHFLWAGLAKHAQTGGLVPSQRFLIDKMIAPVPPAYDGELIELGAGNGALTVRLADRCPRARILACEMNPALACDARQRLAAAGVGARAKVLALPAQRLLSDIAGGGGAKCDFILSGLPLGNLGRTRAAALIDLVGHSLAQTGCYIQFQHSLLDRGKIQARFRDLRTELVLLNIPPAFIYHARRPVLRN